MSEPSEKIFMPPMRSQSSPPASSARGSEAYRGFEAMVLSNFVESMLPSNASSVFGTGTAGGIWKSMLAQQIGTELARSGGIGIATQLAATHPAGSRESASVPGEAVSNAA